MLDAAVVRCRDRVASLAAEALARAREERDAVELLRAIWGLVEEELAACRPAGAPPPACRPGCATCCTINVGTLAIEGAGVAAFLRERAASGGLPETAAALAAFHDRVRWLEDRERVAARLACPFTDAAGRCAIHAARPLACRSVSSLDPGDCRRALAHPDDDEDAPVVRMDLLQRALYDAARVALAEALEARGLDARSRDVSGMTAAFLPDAAAAAAFLAGARLAID